MPSLFNIPFGQGLIFRPKNVKIQIGTGSPQSAVTAAVGSIYIDVNGTADTMFWQKTSGTGNTGWTVDAYNTPTFTSIVTALSLAKDVVANNTLGAAGALTLTSGKAVFPVVGSAGPQTGCTVPSGATAGQVILIEGTDNTNTAQFSVNGATNILARNGATTRTLGSGDSMLLVWDDIKTKWIEVAHVSVSGNDPTLVGSGGTGRTTLTNHGVLVGAAAAAVTQLAVGATGTILQGASGADPAFTANPTVTDLTCRRIAASGGTALGPGDVTLTGWGASANVSFATGSDDTRGQVIVTTNVADTPSANPTIQIVFKDGTFTSVPIPVVTYDSSSSGPNATPGLTALPPSVTAVATSMTITYQGTPTATNAKTYKYNYIVIK